MSPSWGKASALLPLILSPFPLIGLTFVAAHGKGGAGRTRGAPQLCSVGTRLVSSVAGTGDSAVLCATDKAYLLSAVVPADLQGSGFLPCFYPGCSSWGFDLHRFSGLVRGDALQGCSGRGGLQASGGEPEWGEESDTGAG